MARLLKRAEIEGRSDDNEDTIRVRLREYAEKTAPLLDVYRQQGILVEVDGLGPIDEVSSRLFEALDKVADPPAATVSRSVRADRVQLTRSSRSERRRRDAARAADRRPVPLAGGPGLRRDRGLGRGAERGHRGLPRRPAGPGVVRRDHAGGRRPAAGRRADSGGRPVRRDPQRRHPEPGRRVRRRLAGRAARGRPGAGRPEHPVRRRHPLADQLHGHLRRGPGGVRTQRRRQRLGHLPPHRPGHRRAGGRAGGPTKFSSAEWLPDGRSYVYTYFRGRAGRTAPRRWRCPAGPAAAPGRARRRTPTSEVPVPRRRRADDVRRGDRRRPVSRCPSWSGPSTGTGSGCTRWRPGRRPEPAGRGGQGRRRAGGRVRGGAVDGSRLVVQTDLDAERGRLVRWTSTGSAAPEAATGSRWCGEREATLLAVEAVRRRLRGGLPRRRRAAGPPVRPVRRATWGGRRSPAAPWSALDGEPGDRRVLRRPVLGHQPDPELPDRHRHRRGDRAARPGAGGRGGLRPAGGARSNGGRRPARTAPRCPTSWSSRTAPTGRGRSPRCSGATAASRSRSWPTTGPAGRAGWPRAVSWRWPTCAAEGSSAAAGMTPGGWTASRTCSTTSSPSPST